MAEITASLVKAAPRAHRRGDDGVQERPGGSQGRPRAKREVVLRKRGIASAGKKASRATKQGLIGTYIHHGGQLGVMVEVNCESRFRGPHRRFPGTGARCRDAHRGRRPALHPQGRRHRRRAREGKGIQQARALAEGKPEKMLDKIVEGRMAKFYEEVCLLEQPFVKEATLTVGQLVKTKIAKLGENISRGALRPLQSGRCSRPRKPAATGSRRPVG